MSKTSPATSSIHIRPEVPQAAVPLWYDESWQRQVAPVYPKALVRSLLHEAIDTDMVDPLRRRAHTERRVANYAGFAMRREIYRSANGHTFKGNGFLTEGVIPMPWDFDATSLTATFNPDGVKGPVCVPKEIARKAVRANVDQPFTVEQAHGAIEVAHSLSMGTVGAIINGKIVNPGQDVDAYTLRRSA